jgi:hypothetical protein
VIWYRECYASQGYAVVWASECDDDLRVSKFQWPINKLDMDSSSSSSAMSALRSAHIPSTKGCTQAWYDLSPLDLID